jgi:hypothetical protein
LFGSAHFAVTCSTCSGSIRKDFPDGSCAPPPQLNREKALFHVPSNVTTKGFRLGIFRAEARKGGECQFAVSIGFSNWRSREDVF